MQDVLLPIDYSVVDENLVRGSRPTPFIIEQFHAIISLERGWFEFFTRQDKEECLWCIRSNTIYFNFLLSDFFRPRKSKLKKIIFEINQLKREGPVLVHCLHGKDRTGMVIAAYRIIMQKWPVDKAIAEMYEHGFHRWCYWWWVKSLRELE